MRLLQWLLMHHQSFARILQEACVFDFDSAQLGAETALRADSLFLASSELRLAA